MNSCINGKSYEDNGYESMHVSMHHTILKLWTGHIMSSYQIVSLFDMYIDMGERIAGKPDRPSHIIENPLRAP